MKDKVPPNLVYESKLQMLCEIADYNDWDMKECELYYSETIEYYKQSGDQDD